MNADNTLQQQIADLNKTLLNYALMLTSRRDLALRLLKLTKSRVADDCRNGSSDNLRIHALDVMRGIFDGSFGMDEMPHGSYDREKVAVLISRLADNERPVMEMYITGHEPADIARQLGVPVKRQRAIFAAIISRVKE